MELGVDVRHLQETLQALVGERNPCSGQRHLASVEMFIEKEMAVMACRLKATTSLFWRRELSQRNRQAGWSIVETGDHCRRAFRFGTRLAGAPTITPAALRFCSRRLGFSPRHPYERRSYSVPSSSRSSIWLAAGISHASSKKRDLEWMQ